MDHFSLVCINHSLLEGEEEVIVQGLKNKNENVEIDESQNLTDWLSQKCSYA